MDQDETIRVAYVAESFFTTSGRVFEDVDVVQKLLTHDECKSLCIADADCVSFRYSADELKCTIGSVSSEMANVNSTQPYDSLEAKSPDIATYLSVYTCYAGEQVTTAPTISTIDQSEGYTHFPMTCLDTTSIAVLQTVDASAAECGLFCQQDQQCIGFTYFKDHG